MKLTKRESILITILMFVLLNVGVVGYVILPMIPQYQQLQEEADALQLDLDMKLLLVQATNLVQERQNEISTKLNQTKKEFLPVLAPEEMDAYLNQVITPITSAWRTVGIGMYDMAEVKTDGSPLLLSYVSRAEVSVEIKASIPVVMQVMKKFHTIPEYIGIKNIHVNSNGATFVVEFYSFNGERAE